MTKRILLLSCLSLLCAASSNAQIQWRPSPLMRGFNQRGALQLPGERIRLPDNLPRIAAPRPLVPRAPIYTINRLPVVKAVATPWQPPRRVVRIPVAPLTGYFQPAPVAHIGSLTKPSVRTVDAPRLIVRANPRSWYEGALKAGDKFTVKAVRGAWAYGNAHGDVHQKDVWVKRDGLTKGAVPTGKGNPPYTIRDHAESRAFMKKNVASWLSPGVADGVKVKLKAATPLYNNYNPRTKEFSGRIKELDPNTPNRELRVCYVTKDGGAAVVRYNGVDKKGKPTKLSQWGIVPCAELGKAKGKKLPCR
jgi:hypothetical protein